MTLEEARLIGRCVVCGKLVGNCDWRSSNVIALAQPLGVVLVHYDHMNESSTGPDVVAFLMSEATTNIKRQFDHTRALQALIVRE